MQHTGQIICTADPTTNKYSTLCTLMSTFDLLKVLDRGNNTLFAPTNAAFAASTDFLNGLSDEDKKQVLLFHVAPTVLTYDSLRCDGLTATLQAQDSKTLCRSFRKFQVGGGNDDSNYPLVDPDRIETGSGNIFVVDNVLLPRLTISKYSERQLFSLACFVFLFV